MAFLACFLIILGLLQWVSVFFRLRGLSLIGPYTSLGIVFGFLLITAGVWLALNEPVVQMLLLAVPALILAAIVLAGAGVITNLTWNPARRLLNPREDELWTVEQVQIPVSLVPVVDEGQSDAQMMPATFLKPKYPTQAQSAVLVICGAGDCRMSFKWHLFGELLAKGIAVLTIDPPGHGDFQHIPITAANALAAGRAAIHWLRAQPEVKRVGVCGISLGGCLASALAAENRDIQAVALISTPIHLDILTRRTYTLEALALFVMPRNLGLLREGSILTLWQEWRTLRRARYGESLYDMIDRLDTRAAVCAIGSRPKLIVHGSRDIAIPLSNAKALYEIAAPRKELLVVRQGTHVSPVLYPREMQYLAAWFARWLNYNHLDAQQAIQQ